MNVKASVALAALAVSTIGVSACASSASKAGAATVPTAVVGSTSATTATASVSPTASATSAPAAASATSGTATAPVHTFVPDAAVLNLPDLAPSRSGAWNSNSVGQVVSAAQIVDPDNCDPIARPQAVDPNYPRNRAWADMRNVTWSSSGNGQVSESVLTYTSNGAASDDFAKHRGWLADCAIHFQWTDAPAKYSISSVQLSGVDGAYAIRVAMYQPDQPASAAGSQGYVYMAVVLRGNSLTVLDVSESRSGDGKPQDPGISAVQHDVQVAAGKLGKAFPPGR